MEEINLSDIFRILKKNWIYCLIALVISGMGAYFFSLFMIEPLYTSSVSMYVNSNAESTNVNINQLNASQRLTSTYIIVLNEGEIFNQLSEELGGQYSPAQLRSFCSLSQIENTEVFKVTVTTPDPELSRDVCTLFSELAPAALGSVVLGGEVRTLAKPTVSTSPSYPNIPKNTLMFALAGAFLTAASFVVYSMLDTRIRSPKEITDKFDFPLLGIVPNQDAAYEQIRRTKKTTAIKNATANNLIYNPIINDKTPFSVLEAYNTICANISFMLSEENRKVIVVTSSNPSECKSTTSSNLAIALAQSGVHVLLIDCDFRKPTLHNYVRTPNEQGFSNVIAGFCEIEDVLFEEIKPNLDLITAGTIPPNPVTLLSSEKTRKLISQLSIDYDYVIIDSPPLNLVADASLISRHSSGVIMVVRERKTTLPALNQATNLLSLANANIIGAVMTCGEIAENTSNYGYGYGYSISPNR